MTTKNRNMEILAGILLAFIAVSNLSSMVSSLRFGYLGASLITSLIVIAGHVLLAVCLFRGKRDVLVLVGIGLLTLLSLISVISFLFSGNLLMLLKNLFSLASYAVLLLIALSVVMNLKQIPAGTLRLVPMLAAAVSAALNLVFTFSNALSFGLLMMLPSLFGALIGAVLSVVVILLVSNWLLAGETQANAGAASIAAQKQAQLVYYYDLYTKGAITAEEYEAKRQQIENS